FVLVRLVVRLLLVGLLLVPLVLVLLVLGLTLVGLVVATLVVVRLVLFRFVLTGAVLARVVLARAVLGGLGQRGRSRVAAGGVAAGRHHEGQDPQRRGRHQSSSYVHPPRLGAHRTLGISHLTDERFGKQNGQFGKASSLRILRPMAGKRAYDDPCGIARALDVVGERWALLVVRE